MMTRSRSDGVGLILPALAVLAMALVLAPAAAQPPGPPMVPDYLTVDDDGRIVMSPVDAARWALERSTDLRIQAASVEEAMGQLRQAWAIDALTVRAEGAALLMGPVSTFELPGAEGEDPTTVELGQDYALRATVSATKPIYTGGRAGLAVDLAEEGVGAARLGTEIARLSVSLVAREVGYGMLRAMQLAGIAAAQVTAIAEHVGQAQALEGAGLVPHFDVVQANTELARAQEGLITAQTAIGQLQAQLRRVLALPQDVELALVDPPPPDMPDGELRDLIEQAWANRPEVSVGETAVRMARINLSLAVRDLTPSVALTGSLSGQNAAGLGGTNYSWQVGVVVEKPIFDGGARRGKIEAARAKLLAAELELQRAQEEIALEVARHFLSIDEALERIATAGQGDAEARERRRMAQLRYREGLAAGIEVLDADTALAAAEASFVNAEYDLQLAVTRLRTAMGIMDVPQQEVETQ